MCAKLSATPVFWCPDCAPISCVFLCLFHVSNEVHLRHEKDTRKTDPDRARPRSPSSRHRSRSRSPALPFIAGSAGERDRDRGARASAITTVDVLTLFLRLFGHGCGGKYSAAKSAFSRAVRAARGVCIPVFRVLRSHGARARKCFLGTRATKVTTPQRG